MTKQTTILTFLPKPIGRPYFRLDAEDVIVAFCGGTAYGPLKWLIKKEIVHGVINDLCDYFH